MRQPESPCPLHLSAYPALTAETATTRWRRGRPKFIWRSREAAFVGHGQVESISPWEMEVRYWVEDLPYLKSQRGGLRIGVAFAGRQGKPKFRCPLCTGTQSKLVVGNYGLGCAICYVLKPISSVVPARIRKADEIRRIYETIMHGRPPRMRNKDYSELYHRLHRLVNDVPDWRNVTIPDLPIIMRPVWMRDRDHPELDI